MRRQVFGSGLARGACDGYDGLAPCFIDATRQLLKSGNGVFDQKQTRPHRAQAFGLLHMIVSSHCAERSACEGVRDEAVAVLELAVEARARVVFLREGEKK